MVTCMMFSSADVVGIVVVDFLLRISFLCLRSWNFHPLYDALFVNCDRAVAIGGSV